MKLIVCGLSVGAPGPTVKACCTGAAASYAALPACVATTVQVPAPTSATEEPEIAQTPPLPGVTEKPTARPELADAVTA